MLINLDLFSSIGFREGMSKVTEIVSPPNNLFLSDLIVICGSRKCDHSPFSHIFMLLLENSMYELEFVIDRVEYSFILFAQCTMIFVNFRFGTTNSI